MSTDAPSFRYQCRNIQIMKWRCNTLHIRIRSSSIVVLESEICRNLIVISFYFIQLCKWNCNLAECQYFNLSNKTRETKKRKKKQGEIPQTHFKIDVSMSMRDKWKAAKKADIGKKAHFQFSLLFCFYFSYFSVSSSRLNLTLSRHSNAEWLIMNEQKCQQNEKLNSVHGESATIHFDVSARTNLPTSRQ